MYELMVEDYFHAAHALRCYEGPCENLHGHSFKVQMFVKGSRLGKLGLLVDFKILKKEFAVVLEQFDHKNLNELPAFAVKNPTSEMIAEVIYKLLKKKVKNLTRVVVWESDNSNAAYY